MPPLVSVIVPNWNGERHLPACLDSLCRQTYDHREVIVVDNASSDGSVALVKKGYPQVKILRLPVNRGFAGGANEGIRAAQGDVIALLNNDAEADPNWLAELVAALSQHPEAGMAASKMLLYDRRDVINSAGDFYGSDGVPGNRGVWQRDSGQYQREEWVFGPCGGAAAYRRMLLDQVGLLDEAFFFSVEDVDLAWRAQLAGYRCIYVPRAVVYHKLSATGGGPTASYYCGRNFIYVLAKDMPGSLLRKHWPAMVRAQLRLAWESLRHFREAAARARLRGQLTGLLHVPRLLKARREVQASKRVSDEYLETILSRG